MADVEELAQELGVLVRGLRELHESVIARCDQPLEAASAVLLHRVQQLEPVRLTEVASSLGLDVSTVSRQVSALVARGWIARTPDPQDLRAHVLGLTDDGRSTAEVLRSTRRQVFSRMLPDWTPEDLTALTTQLARLNADLAVGPDRLELAGPARHRKA